MIRKFRIFFRFESGVVIEPYTSKGLSIEAYTAEDALFQAGVEIDEINRRKNMIGGDRWTFTQITPEPPSEPQFGFDPPRIWDYELVHGVGPACSVQPLFYDRVAHRWEPIFMSGAMIMMRREGKR